MPVKVQQGTDPLGYLGRGEHDWRLMRVVAFDGLQPVLIGLAAKESCEKGGIPVKVRK